MGVLGLLFFPLLLHFRLNERMIPIILLAIFLVFVGSIYMLEKALYKNVRSTVLANEEQFKAAVNSSLIWGGFPTRKPHLVKFSFFFVYYIYSSIFV